MKKLLLILSFITLIISCSPRTFPTKFHEFSTTEPQELVDSILRADTLYNLLGDYRSEWNRSMYITSDSVIVTQYVGLCTKKDTTYIISIIEEKDDSIVYVKFRKE